MNLKPFYEQFEDKLTTKAARKSGNRSVKEPHFYQKKYRIVNL